MMRYVPNDKYTIAWFKLAECVAKGEKEKAFGVYRLLMHSFDDQAYAHQLEGDLLGAFQDQRASEKYAHAAHLYAQNNRFKEAAVLYHDLIVLVPEDQRYINRLIDVYKRQANSSLFITKLIKLAEFLIDHNRPLHAMIVANELEECAESSAVAEVYANIIMKMSSAHEEIHDFHEPIARAVEFLAKKGKEHQLQSMLSVLEQTNQTWYHALRKLLQDI